ncbi:Rho termination factor N-terminal domain-containing protein [Bailinhaonella thermotolerans]|uniref:Rho termination factor-like N-terminal domain-containing protein n=1 Tax=Bailinhaonella thermotolerans TaxID=1070861 RepID=A0A3A4AKA8_9ACTN|nr:Rho termination factor N-terminal domain-containing protein [Bailinhaonella thermotolerans]RJL30086.1 hypothetical protein D5H75_24485 [Bailinhaonella thermotolerans]
MSRRDDPARYKDIPGNQTANTPGVNESDIAKLKMDQLRERAKELGVPGGSRMRKQQLVDAVSDASAGRGPAGRGVAAPEAPAKKSGKGKGAEKGGGVRRGPESSRSLQYSQEIRSPGQEPDRPGRSLVTTSHEVIKQWAEERGATPATVEGTSHDDHLGVLRFDFPGYGGGGRLRHVSWDEWFHTFDERGLNFIYQETKTDGTQSNFFRLEHPRREDA